MYGSSILRTIQLYKHPFPPISSDNLGSTVQLKFNHGELIILTLDYMY